MTESSMGPDIVFVFDLSFDCGSKTKQNRKTCQQKLFIAEVSS